MLYRKLYDSTKTGSNRSTFFCNTLNKRLAFFTTQEMLYGSSMRFEPRVHRQIVLSTIRIYVYTVIF